MNYSLVAAIIAVAAYTGFFGGRIYEGHSTHVKEMACIDKAGMSMHKNRDLVYEFYNVPVEMRRTKIQLGYNSISAFMSYQIDECRYNHKLFGE